MIPREPGCEWTAAEMQDPAVWTETLGDAELAELERAVEAVADQDFLDVDKAAFALPALGPRLAAIEAELMHGRGFVRLRGLPRDRWTNDQMCRAYWGIGMHLGRPWPQNVKGHLLGDVTDQGKRPGDPTARGNELGLVGLDYHCDGSDLVGLLCLQTGASGGLSAVCNSVALHNRMVRERPDLAAELYLPQPHDLRGEEAPGEPPWRMRPVFIVHEDRLFVHLIAPYIRASQRHDGAPRLTALAREALDWMDAEAEAGAHAVTMALEPGDMQFINNHHVLHGRTPYEDDPAAGRVRHLKRLWLETGTFGERPPQIGRPNAHWLKRSSISRLDLQS